MVSAKAKESVVTYSMKCLSVFALGGVGFFAEPVFSQEKPNNDPYAIELNMSVDEFDPLHPDGTLVCTAHNISEQEQTIPFGFNSDTAGVYGQGFSVKPLHAPTTRWPLKLYRRVVSDQPLKSVSLRPGGKIKLFELQLKEILASRDAVALTDKKVSPLNDHPKNTWGWDWIAHPRPPATPIHTQDGFAELVEFWAVVSIGNDSITSNRHQIKVKNSTNSTKLTKLTKMIWETTGGGDVKFTVEREASEFKIHLTRHAFKDQDIHIKLTADHGKPYKTLQEIFAKKRSIPNDPTMANRTTGSWTTISLVSGDSKAEVIKHAQPWKEGLNEISQFVDAAVRE